MRNLYAGGGMLAAGILLVLGLVMVTGSSSTPVAEAQTGCSEDVNCLVIAKVADPSDTDDEFDFDSDAGDFSLMSGDEETIEVETGDSVAVTELETEGWSLLNIDCEGADVDGIDVDETDDSLTVTFDTAEDEFATVTCTFVNEMDETPTPTATATETQTTPTTTATPTVTSTPAAPTPTVSIGGGSVRPPNTGSGGLK